MFEISIAENMVAMPVKKCALCLETRELCDSHFLPAGFYRILNDRDEWIAHVSDEQIVANLKACLLAMTTCLLS